MSVAARPLTGLAVCAGVGAIELGLRLVFGGGYRTVGYVERDSYAAAALVARMADQALDPAPVWDDVTTFDGVPWRGRVDLVSAGFPCQPFSAAGKRQGTNDERWVWPDIARVVGELGPRLLLLENVPGLALSGLGPVLGDLADLGFDAEWGLFSAASVGAGHLRRRIIILSWLRAMADTTRWQLASLGIPRPPELAVADARGEGLEPLTDRSDRSEAADAGWAEIVDHQPRGAGEDVADRHGWGCSLLGREPGHHRNPRENPDGCCGSPLANAQDDGSVRRRSDWRGRPETAGDWIGPAVDSEAVGDAPGPRQQGPIQWTPQRRPRPSWPGCGLPLFPPGPDDLPGWEAARRAGGPQPAVRRVAHGLAHRLDRLHAIGNGVVPLMVAVAFDRLARRAGLVEGRADR